LTGIVVGLAALFVGLALGAAFGRLRPVGAVVGRGAAVRLDARLDAYAAELRRIADATAVRDGVGDQLRIDIASSRRVLEELRVRDEERHRADDESREFIRRLSTVLSGAASKGTAGERLLREHLSHLPPSMLCSDFRVNGKTVEFALVLPDGRRLPVDSKWAGNAELEALEATEDPVERTACARAVERAVASRAKEVAQYLDPALTAPVAVAAVPDAAYGVLKRAHAEAWASGVVIVPYSFALPAVLFLYSLVQRFGDAADAQAALAQMANFLDQMESVVENKFSRAATMLTNGADEFRTSLGKARGSIARARSGPQDGASDEGVLKVVR
jgi:hypothetical protein